MDNERRKHPRIRLLAQVKLRREGMVHSASTLDVSLSGLFVAGDPAAYPDLEVGSEVQFALYPTPELAEQGAQEVHGEAHVVRIESGGVRHAGLALEIQRIDGDNMLRLAAMIKRYVDAAAAE